MSADGPSRKEARREALRRAAAQGPALVRGLRRPATPGRVQKVGWGQGLKTTLTVPSCFFWKAL